MSAYKAGLRERKSRSKYTVYLGTVQCTPMYSQSGQAEHWEEEEEESVQCTLH